MDYEFHSKCGACKSTVGGFIQVDAHDKTRQEFAGNVLTLKPVLNRKGGFDFSDLHGETVFKNKEHPNTVVDRNKLYVLIEDLITAGFRGSTNWVVKRAIEKYNNSLLED